MKIIGMLAICLALSTSPAFAAEKDVVEEWYLYPSVQYFTWEEFSGGRRLLKEEGALFGFGGGALFDLYRKSLMLKVNGEMFGGVVGYRGQTQNLSDLSQHERPLRTDVVYFGTKLESDLGWRVPTAAGSFEPFGGLGYRWWLRGLEDSTASDTSGNPFPVGGYTEVWHTLYTRLGLRWSYAADSDLTLFAEGGGKYPFLNRNLVDYPGVGNVTIKPEPRWSAFAEIGARYGRFRPALFYEGFRFGQSADVSVLQTINGSTRLVRLSQPKSESDIFGINLAWAFR